mmetsp:Transcript_4820/g.12717  ORF Transcript_4820/g.12717 Transcript_4820/m.12717 type:complete len:219 (+) Transcript_4820:369-1025(+)
MGRKTRIWRWCCCWWRAVRRMYARSARCARRDAAAGLMLSPPDRCGHSSGDRGSSGLAAEGCGRCGRRWCGSGSRRGDADHSCPAAARPRAGDAARGSSSMEKRRLSYSQPTPTCDCAPCAVCSPAPPPALAPRCPAQGGVHLQGQEGDQGEQIPLDLGQGLPAARQQRPCALPLPQESAAQLHRRPVPCDALPVARVSADGDRLSVWYSDSTVWHPY